MSTHKLSELGFSDLIAPAGKFRSIALIDSGTYQIGDDSNTLAEAQQKCIDTYRPLSSFYVYNDIGGQEALRGLEYHIALKDALDAQVKVASLEETLRGAKFAQEALRATAREILKPYIDQALREFRTKHGIRITVDDKGIQPCEHQSVGLDVRMFHKGDREFTGDLPNRQELETSITDRLRVILEEIFRTNGLPLTLGEITVPSHYWKK